MIENQHSSFNLWKVMVVLAHRRTFIIGFVCLATITAVVVALVLPKWYRAKTSILPSQIEQNIGLTGNIVQYAMSSAGFELPMMATPSDVYATMLKSETIARAVITENKLQSHYNFKTFQECYLYLRDMTKISVTSDGIVELYYEDKDPQLAAVIANSYVKHLDSLNRQVKVAKAASDRKFIEERLAANQLLLDSARALLLSFQSANKTVDLDQQRDLAIKSATDLKSRLALTQVQLDVKRKMYSSGHPEVVQLENETAELKKQMDAIEKGSGTASYLGLPLADIPDLTIRYTALKATVDLQSKVHELLTSMYEEARIKEQKDTPTISILETAYPPELKYSPKRTLIVVITFAASLILAVFLALFADYLENLRRTSPSDFELLDQARREFTGKHRYHDS
jgi:tyrosine-protein kinase Etk/Wzc